MGILYVYGRKMVKIGETEQFGAILADAKKSGQKVGTTAPTNNVEF